MESFTITVTGKTSELKSVFFPPIDLDGNYEIGVVDFQSYNSIYNVVEPDNVLYYNEHHVIYIPNGVYKFDDLKELDGLKDKVEFSVENDVIKIKSLDPNMELNQKAGLMGMRLTFKIRNKIVTDMVDMMIGDNNIYYLNKNEQQKIIIPEDSYEVDHIECIVQKKIPDFKLIPIASSMLVTILSPVTFDFTKPGLGQSMLGFTGITHPNIEKMSKNRVNINNVNVIRINCDIISGSYLNGKQSHSLYAFYPEVSPGFKIVSVVDNILYHPINVRTLDVVTISVVDQNDKLIDFYGEEITLRCHIRKIL